MKEQQNGSVTPGRKQPRVKHQADLGAGASAEAKRRMAAILEVLAGARTPTAAAAALGVSLPRYYLLENQAFQGMLVACEPRSLGRAVTSESALAALQRECEQLRRECARQQALVRVAQRTVGLSPPAADKTKPEQHGKKRRRRRRPMVRALRAVARLKEGVCEPVVTPAATTES